MNCHDSERLFDLYLDREITVQEGRDLGEHLRICPRCAENWLAARKAADLLSALPDEDPGPDIVSRVTMLLPRARRWTRPLRLPAWQAAAAVLIGLVMVGAAFVSGTRQMTAAAVENRRGHTVVVPQPGRPLIIPPGATILGDLRIDGDACIQGRVEGKVTIAGRLRSDLAGGFGGRVRQAVDRILSTLGGLFSH